MKNSNTKNNQQVATSHQPLTTNHYIKYALRLAEGKLGSTYPNPAVGAVIVKDGIIVGVGATAKGGRPHAEIIALEQAGERANGATLYVTLEPCCHHGKSPPCCDAIVKSGIKKVVAACGDINQVVSGQGFAKLRANGIEVVENICQAEAEKLNEGFFSVIKHKKSFVTLKLATSLDGKIATATSESKWITNKKSRDYAHLLRAKNDAILTGIGTIITDNPELNCRIIGRENESPIRIIIDSKLRINIEAKSLPAWIFTTEQALIDNKEKAELLMQNGCEVIESETINLEQILIKIAEKGITRLLIEAGSLASAFLENNLVDRIYWFRAPLVIGESGISVLKGNNLPLSDIKRYKLTDSIILDNDILEVYDLN